MNLRHWEIVRAVLATGSVTRAAEKLGISQPSVSQALRYAEGQLGFALFKRQHGSLMPTAEANALVPEIETVFERVSHMNQFARDLRSGKSGFVKAATIATLAGSLFPKAIEELRRRYPGVRIKLSVFSTAEVVKLSADHLVDFGVIHTGTSDGGLEVEELIRSEMVCVMRPDHPLAALSAITPEDIRGHTLIAARNSLERVIAGAFRSTGDGPDMTIEVNHSLTGYRLAEKGLGVALVDPFVLTPSDRAIVRRPFKPAIPLQTRILYSKNRPLSQVALELMSVLRGVANEWYADHLGDARLTALTRSRSSEHAN
jgi:DNA-binding transcriptional LysR family regulator